MKYLLALGLCISSLSHAGVIYNFVGDCDNSPGSACSPNSGPAVIEAFGTLVLTEDGPTEDFTRFVSFTFSSPLGSFTIDASNIDPNAFFLFGPPPLSSASGNLFVSGGGHSFSQDGTGLPWGASTNGTRLGSGQGFFFRQVPEPNTVGLLLLALFSVFVVRPRRRYRL